MLERMSMQHHSGCGCGAARNDMRSQDRSSCSMCDSDRSVRNTERQETEMRTREQVSCPMCRNERSAQQEEHNGCGCENNMESNMRSRERSEGNSERSGCGCSEQDTNMCSRERSSCPMCDRERSMRREEREGCDCDRNTDIDNANFNYSLAMVYSPCQEWQNLYCEEEGMMAGTIFKELDKPFYGAKCHGGNGNV